MLEGDFSRLGAADVAGVLAQLADDLAIGTRYEALDFEYRHPGRARSATLNGDVRARLAAAATAAAADERQQLLRGTLVEADFERFTARLRMPDGTQVTVSFDLGLADDVQHALRRPSALEGVVAFDRYRQIARSVQLRSIVRSQQLAMGFEPVDFWHDRTVEELAEEQGTGVVENLATLRDEEASEEEVAALFAALDLEADRSS